VFKSDDNFLENEEKYKQLKKGSIFCKLSLCVHCRPWYGIFVAHATV